MDIFITLIFACGIVLGAVGLLGISWLLTGKSSLQPGACGRDPTKKRRDEECGACQLCEDEKKINEKQATKDLHD